MVNKNQFYVYKQINFSFQYSTEKKVIKIYEYMHVHYNLAIFFVNRGLFICECDLLLDILK